MTIFRRAGDVGTLGRELERRSRAAVARVSDRWLAGFRWRRWVTLRTAEAVLMATCLAGLVVLLGAEWLAARRLDAAREVENDARARLQLLERRYCLVYPKLCDVSTADIVRDPTPIPRSDGG